MGTTFRYIADGGLPYCVAECQHCGRANAPTFDYGGTIVDPTRANDPDLAREEPEVEELCADCILGGNVRKDDRALGQILRLAGSLAAGRQQAIEAFHHMPDVTFVQGATWPICCGEWVEYVGDHVTPGTAFADYEPWQPQNDRMTRFTLADFYPLEKLPVLFSMALFRCLHCPRRFWVFQYSGLFWPGPRAG